MTDRNNDDVARALEALSAGEHHEDERQNESIHSPPPPPPTQPRPAARPPGPQQNTPPKPQAASSKAQAPRPKSAAAATPAASGMPAKTPKPAARPVSPGTPRPAGPGSASPAGQRPAAPVARRAAPATGARPAVPTASPAAQPTAPQSEAQVVDDDAVIVPAPDASVFLHKPQYAPKPTRQAFGQSIHFRQTLIPILLTAGFILVCLGALHFLWTGENNPLTDLPGWLLGVLFGFGALLWVLAIANMLSVKSALEASKAGRPGRN